MNKGPKFHIHISYDESSDTTHVAGISHELDFFKMIRLVQTELKCKCWFKKYQRSTTTTVYTSGDQRTQLKFFFQHYGISDPRYVTIGT